MTNIQKYSVPKKLNSNDLKAAIKENNLQYHKALFLLDQLVYIRTMRPDIVSSKGLFPVNARLLQTRVIDYKKYLNLFVDIGLIDRTDKYTIGRSKAVKLINGYDKGVKLLKAKGLIRTPKSALEKYKHLIDFFPCITATKNIGVLKKINEGKFNPKVADHGRLYTTLTETPKKLRQFLRLNDEPTATIDFNNMHPLLLAKWFTDHYKVYDNPELQAFSELSQLGLIYEYIAKKQCITREEAKTALNTALNGTVKRFRANKAKRIIFEVFPQVVNTINAKQEIHPKYWHITLNRFETDLILKRASKTEYPVFTIHDCLCVPIEKTENAIHKLKDSFFAFSGGLNCNVTTTFYA